MRRRPSRPEKTTQTGEPIKNPKADVSIAAKRLPRGRSWALTGTPMENCIEDLISVLEFAAPGRFDPRAMAVGLRRLLGEV